MSPAATSVDAYQQAFERRREKPAARTLSTSQRDAAWAAFAALGFPTTRDEDWRYTNLRRLLRRNFSTADEHPGSAAGIDKEFLDIAGATRLVFLDGQFVESLSVTDSEIAFRLSAASQGGNALPAFDSIVDIERHRFAALNTAMFTDGAIVNVPNRQEATATVYLIFLSTQRAAGVAVHPRVFVEVGTQSRLRLIEHHVGLDGADNFVNSICEIKLGQGAVAEHTRIQDGAESGFNIAGLHVSQARDSRFVSHNYCLGGALTRNDLVVLLEEPGSHCSLNGLFMVDGAQHADNHVRIDHLSHNTRSEQNYRGVANGRSRGVYNGKVVVHVGADKTDAEQSSKNLLLSDTAEIDTKPELEIYADDVKCSHGATVGQLDADALFYLRSRGIDNDTAVALLTYAFAEDVVASVGVPEIRRELDQRILGRLPARDIIREFV